VAHQRIHPLRIVQTRDNSHSEPSRLRQVQGLQRPFW
jgi:hypothetical protein